MSRLRSRLPLALLLLATTARAESAREILDQVIAVNRAREPKDASQTLRMKNTLRGDVLFARELEVASKFYGDDTSKSVTFFLSPVDIKGVGYLAWSDPHQGDSQWLYLPKLHRVRMIGRPARQQSFEESVFTYEDLELFREMTRWTETDAETTLVAPARDADGIPCVVIELAPRRGEVSYGRIPIWIDRRDATVHRAEFYQRDDGKLVKTARFAEFTSVDGIPVANRIEFENVRSGLATTLEVISTRFNLGLDEEEFAPWHMERVIK